ncbi:uncharacterized protein CDAR_587811 [Caerostris darwini]|uniref:Uncharacterized protein n=1 Tax=Caerostris darwini TaxID=1538125 RepID=A0AAV4UH35_9ARAC|nr:uncharacterized protein CDAR_587811 [Caerostris darwini]
MFTLELGFFLLTSSFRGTEILIDSRPRCWPEKENLTKSQGCQQKKKKVYPSLKTILLLKMPSDSLLKICLRETSDLVKSEYWAKEETNPFLTMPCHVVTELLECMAHSEVEPEDLQLLLKSGQLLNLDLHYFEFTAEQWECVMRILIQDSNSCRNIKNICTSFNYQNNEKALLEKVIEKCLLLEDVYAETFFNPSVLKNCKNLRRVTINYGPEELSQYLHSETIDTISHLQNLERFLVFELRKPSSYYLLVAKMLRNHPKLVSFGLADSSWAAYHIYTTSGMDPVPQFALRKCFWGFNVLSDEFDPESEAIFLSHFPELVQSAVHLFPLVVDLFLTVHHKDCIQHLKCLKHLRVLRISFELCTDSSAQSSFLCVLTKIGRQLKYLSIWGDVSMPVDAIMEHCVGVEHLALHCRATTWKKTEDQSGHFAEVNSMRVENATAGALKCLLQNAPNLRKLLLVEAACLDDRLMHTILRRNPLDELESIGVETCTLSRKGLKELFLKAKNLRKVSFDSLMEEATVLAKELKKDMIYDYSYLEKVLDSL